VATAETTYVDPSALARLYLHQAGSRQMYDWRRRHRGALPVTHHGRTELINAISLAEFHEAITSDAAAAAQELLESDFAAGHLEQVDLLWRGALNRAAVLSRRHTPKLGTRSLDVLHVACALELRLRQFLTFDDRQSKLAKAAGLTLVQL
jgi:predicted nucleic acid-binding protein